LAPDEHWERHWTGEPIAAALCRAIHYCNACRQSFEQFKPV